MFFPTDPIELGAQARVMLEKLHERKDIIVQMRTNNSGFAEDGFAEDSELAKDGGHYRDDRKSLNINLDKVLDPLRPAPTKLNTIEDWRLFPVLAGVAAHESAHAKYTRWHDTKANPFPETLVNPDYDPAHPVRLVPNPDYDVPGDDLSKLLPKEIEDIDFKGPEYFPVSEHGGRMIELAKILEEPRVERLAKTHFTKTWKKALEFSASHLTLESMDETEEEDSLPLDQAVNLAILVGGRLNAGTLGATPQSRTSAQKVLDSAQKVIETALPTAHDPFYAIMGIIAKAILDNEHDDANSHLEAARRILAITHPESTDDPDSGSKNPKPQQSGGEQASGAGMPGSGDSAEGEGPSEAEKEAMEEAIAEAMAEAEAALSEMKATGEQAAEEEAKEQKEQQSPGYGTTDGPPIPPQIARYEDPTPEDRSLYRRVKEWMEKQITPTITESEYGQWMPGGNSKLNVRSMIRDDLSGRIATQRTDWDRTTDMVKAAPPVKVAVMLDGSGSMGIQARFSASVAWAVANAAADLPEARTVSVVFGNRAAVTQEPGNGPIAKVAVAKTNGGTEDWIGAKALVDEWLRLGDEEEDENGDKPTNVMIVVVSDLMFFGDGQAVAAARDTRDWIASGYKVVNVGCDEGLIEARVGAARAATAKDVVISGGIELMQKDELFRGTE